jgi:hypothetical protein
MNRREFAKKMAAAVAGAVLVTKALPAFADDAEKHACKGANSCKGQGGCKSSDNGCKGKNSCKGKGGCASDMHGCKGQNSCKGMGGCSSGDNGCKGKNSCKGKGGPGHPRAGRRNRARPQNRTGRQNRYHRREPWSPIVGTSPIWAWASACARRIFATFSNNNLT